MDSPHYSSCRCSRSDWNPFVWRKSPYYGSPRPESPMPVPLDLRVRQTPVNPPNCWRPWNAPVKHRALSPREVVAVEVLVGLGCHEPCNWLTPITSFCHCPLVVDGPVRRPHRHLRRRLFTTSAAAVPAEKKRIEVIDLTESSDEDVESSDEEEFDYLRAMGWDVEAAPRHSTPKHQLPRVTGIGRGLRRK